jgi:hypothetical protein
VITDQMINRLIMYQKMIRSRSKHRPPRALVEQMAIDFFFGTPSSDNATDLYQIGFSTYAHICPRYLRGRIQSQYYRVYSRMPTPDREAHHRRIYPSVYSRIS